MSALRISEPDEDHVVDTLFNIPEDLVVDILLRLPVKSLLRFKTVCKVWRAIITSLDFSNKHLVLHKDEGDDTSLLLCWFGADKEVVLEHGIGNKIFAYGFTLVSNETLERFEKQPDYLKLPGLVKDVRGPCNGVFCIRVGSNKLALWNPATRRLRPLHFDEDHHLLLSELQDCEFGFGTDPLTGQLKVVAIDRDCGFNKFCLYDHLQCSSSWMVKDSDQLHANDSEIKYDECSRSFINGFCYWIRTNNSTRISVILAFDIHNELFEVIELPEVIRSWQSGALDLYDDSLSIFAVNPTLSYGEWQFGIWVMKEKGDWMKVLDIDRPHCHWTLSFLKRNVALVHVEWRLVFDFDSGTWLNGVDELEDEDMNTVLVKPLYTYRPSLASLESTTTDHGFQDCDMLSPLCRRFFST